MWKESERESCCCGGESGEFVMGGVVFEGGDENKFFLCFSSVSKCIYVY